MLPRGRRSGLLSSIFALAATVAIIATPSGGRADLIDEINKLGAGGGGASGAASSLPSLAATPLGKFAASGRITESIATGPCAGSVEASSCSSGCDAVTITGPVNATSLGNATLSACITITSLTSGSFSSCLNGLGTGTITGGGGNSIKLGIGGLFCLADAFPLPTPTTAIFVGNDTYAVEGGTGSFATAVGTGTVSFSDVVTSLTGSPIPGSGQITLGGSLAKK